MDSSVSLFGFGTFGNPNGFQQAIKAGRPVQTFKSFDLNTTAISLFPNDVMYGIRRERAGEEDLICYSAYRHAREATSQRSGTFVGCAVVVIDAALNSGLIAGMLQNALNEIYRDNVVDGVLQARDAASLKVATPPDWDKLELNREGIGDYDFPQVPTNTLLVYNHVEGGALAENLAGALKLLDTYEAVYFTNSSEAIEFAYKSGLYQIMQKEEFAAAVQEAGERLNERRQAFTGQVSQRIQEYRKAMAAAIEQLEGQLQAGLKQHEVNAANLEELKQLRNRRRGMHQDFNGMVQHYVYRVNSGLPLKEARLGIQQLEAQLQAILRQPVQLPAVSNINTTLPAGTAPGFVAEASAGHDNSQLDETPAGGIQSMGGHSRRSSRKSSDTNLYMVVSGVLALLLIGSWAWFVTRPAGGGKEPDLAPMQMVKPDSAATTAKSPIDPPPNGKLSPKAYRSMFNKFRGGERIDQVVGTIFQRNQNDIRSQYMNKENQYAQMLIDSNKKSFELHSGVWIYNGVDTITVIPIHKN